MPFNPQTFQSKLKNGGARANLFEVTIGVPSALSIGGSERSVTNFNLSDNSFYIRKAVVPPETMEPITVKYFGRELYYPGDRTYDELEIEILNDEDMKLRNSLEVWMDYLNGKENNLLNAGNATGGIQTYMSDLVVTHYTKSGQVSKKYKFTSCFPTKLGEIDLNWDAQSEVETYTVSWRFRDFQAIDSNNQKVALNSTPQTLAP